MAVAPPGTRTILGEAIAQVGIHGPQPNELRAAYATLHDQLRSAYSAAFRGRSQSAKGGYVGTYLPEARAKSRTLQEVPTVLNRVSELERIADEIGKSQANAATLAEEVSRRGWPPQSVGLIFLGGPVNDAKAFLRSAAGPFPMPFADYQKRTTAGLDRLLQGTARHVHPGADSPLFAFHAALNYLLAGAFALQAVYSALSARELYEIDGNAGARAAATKLGGPLLNADGTVAESSDLLGINGMHGSLEAYVGRVWRALGVDPRFVDDLYVLPYGELATDLLDAELVSAKRAEPLKSDGLRSWGYPGSRVQAAVARHIAGGSPATGFRFDPTWPVIVKFPARYTLAAQVRVRHADPAAQLGLFVASSLYLRSERFCEMADVEKPPKLAPPQVTAGSLPFGGKHPPHETHRSGAELDLDLEPELRDLTNEKEYLSGRIVKGYAGDAFVEKYFDPKSKTHGEWSKWLTDAITARSVNAKAKPFSDFKLPPFDYYGTKPSDDVVASLRPTHDTPRVVAQARAWCISLLLSGVSRLLFGDPWVFIDVFHRLRDAWEGLATERGIDLPEPYGWVSFEAARDSVMLEPFVHWNHWHAEWKYRPPGHKGPNSELALWVPVWKGLDVDRSELDGHLDRLAAGLTPAVRDSVDRTKESLARAWEAGEAEALKELYPLVYGGPSKGDRELLKDTAHEGTP